MALTIRLKPKSKGNFQIIAIDSKKSRDSKYIERLGFINQSGIYLNFDVFLYWLSKGAILSKSLIKRFEINGIWEILKNDHKIIEKV